MGKAHKVKLRRDAAWHYRLHAKMKEPFVFVDMSGAIQFFNESYRKMLGYTADELKDLTYRDLTPAKWHSIEARIVRRQILPQGASEVYEKEYRRKDGTIIPVELRTFLARNAEGRPEGMWAIVRDITKRKQEQEQRRKSIVELQAASQRLQFYFDRMPLANIVWDSRYVIREWNPAAEQIFGWKAKEAIGKKSFELYVPKDVQPAVILRWKNMVEQRFKSSRGVNENITRDGRKIVCEWFLAPIYDKRNVVVGGIAMGHDITNRVRNEARIKMLNEDLERLVLERTAELSESIADLRSEAKRRERAERGLLLRQRQLAKLVSHLIVAEANERRRIADGLHDDVSQMLAAAKLMAGSIGDEMGKKGNGRVAELNGILDQILKATRTLTFDLASPVLHRLGIKAALEDLCDRMRGGGAIDVVFNADQREIEVNSEVQDFLFQAVKELLRNVERHAKAKRVKVLLGWMEGCVEVVVVDDGIGPAEIKKSQISESGGFGLYAIRERVEYLGGWLKIAKAGAHGSRITLRVPSCPRLQPAGLLRIAQ